MTSMSDVSNSHLGFVVQEEVCDGPFSTSKLIVRQVRLGKGNTGEDGK